MRDIVVVQVVGEYETHDVVVEILHKNTILEKPYAVGTNVSIGSIKKEYVKREDW